MRQVTIQAAETSLPDLVDAALAGEEVVIARGDQPVVASCPVSPAPTGKFKFGILNGKLGRPRLLGAYGSREPGALGGRG